MKIWQIEIGTEEGGENLEVVNGLSEDAPTAIVKAMSKAEDRGYKNPYPSRITQIGEQDF